jgi:hypothetical protein
MVGEIREVQSTGLYPLYVRDGWTDQISKTSFDVIIPRNIHVVESVWMSAVIASVDR